MPKFSIDPWGMELTDRTHCRVQGGGFDVHSSSALEGLGFWTCRWGSGAGPGTHNQCQG